MIKKIFILSLVFIAVLTVDAQSLQLTGDVTVPTSDPCVTTHAYILVKNTSNKDLDVVCQKFIIDTTAGTLNYFCWGGYCYPAETYISPFLQFLPPGASSDSAGFGGYYDAYCADAEATIKYCFYPDTDPTDASCLTVLYNGTVSAIVDLVSEGEVGEFFPNPAKEYINVEYKLDRNSTLTIVDILGNKVKEIDLSNSGFQSIYISDLQNGIYFGRFSTNGNLVKMKKIIVKK